MVRVAIFLCLVALAVAEDLGDLAQSASENRIVGGYYARPGQFPYMTSIQVNQRHVCGGSIVSQRYILTAAHCLYNISGGSNYSVVVGTNDLQRQSSTFRRYQVAQLKPHRRYTGASLNYDVGLIKTVDVIALNSRVQTIAYNPNVIGGGARSRVSGWGYTSYPGTVSRYLKYLDVETITNAQCNSTRVASVTPGMMCTTEPAFTGTCFGDSGSPLVYNGTVIGIVAWVIPCARRYPDGYTRVSYYAKWIGRNMN